MNSPSGSMDDSVGTYDLQASEVTAIHQLRVEHTLNVIHSFGCFCHVQTDRQWVEVVIHVPACEQGTVEPVKTCWLAPNSLSDQLNGV